jgi:hypothetical protein
MNMTIPFRTHLLTIALGLAATCGSLPAASQETPASVDDAVGQEKWYSLPENWDIQGWTVQTSLYTKHFDPDPDHNNDQNLIGIEAYFDRNWMIGVAAFDNSFDQPSQMIYMGKLWHLFGSKYWYGKVIGGFLHGYKEPYEDKIPFNSAGIAPVIIPSIGFRYNWLVVEGALGGLATFTVTAGVHF